MFFITFASFLRLRTNIHFIRFIKSFLTNKNIAEEF